MNSLWRQNSITGQNLEQVNCNLDKPRTNFKLWHQLTISFGAYQCLYEKILPCMWEQIWCWYWWWGGGISWSMQKEQKREFNVNKIMYQTVFEAQQYSTIYLKWLIKHWTNESVWQARLESLTGCIWPLAIVCWYLFLSYLEDRWLQDKGWTENKHLFLFLQICRFCFIQRQKVHKLGRCCLTQPHISYFLFVNHSIKQAKWNFHIEQGLITTKVLCRVTL